VQWRNSARGYGLVAIALHWLDAVAVVGLFGLGLWMVELTYYDPLYRDLPDLHKSIGILLFVAVVLRLGWRFANPTPAPLGSVLEQRAAAVAHYGMYALMFATMFAGYLISTADGRPVSVFGLFDVPALIHGHPDQADVAGEIHQWLAWSLLALASLHALAAVKHHVWDRNLTLARMLRPGCAKQDLN
jgi:cytochrome b561